MSTPARASETAVRARISSEASLSISKVAETGGADDEQVGNFALDGAGRLLHDAVVRPGSGGGFVFFFRQTKKNHGRNAERMRFVGFFDGFIHRKIEDARHGADFFADALARAHEEWIDERFGCQAGFTDQRAQGLVTAKTAKARDGERHREILQFSVELRSTGQVRTPAPTCL